MQSRKENIKALFSNTRSRVIILFTLVLVLVAIVVGYIEFFSSTGDYGTSGANLSKIGSIESIPGEINPNPEYVKLLKQQNVNQAKEARKSGDSAIPTIVRMQLITPETEALLAKPQNQQASPGFTSLSRAGEGGVQKGLWIQSLKESRCAAAVVKKVMGQGASAADVQSVCSCTQLIQGGYGLDQLKGICSCEALKTAGTSASDFKRAGYTAAELRACGFSACQAKAAGFSALAMREGGYSEGELRGAGFPEPEILAAVGLPQGVSLAEVRQSGCDLNALKRLRARGVTAAAIRHINGCTAAQLKAAGYTAADLKKAGFSAKDLYDAGFSPAPLKDAGFDAKALKEPGISASALRALGFAPQALKDAGFSAADLRAAGLPAAQLKAIGFDATALKDAGFSATGLRSLGFSPKALKDAGFSAAELRQAGFSARDLMRALFGDDEIKNAGYPAAELRSLGLTTLTGIGQEPGQSRTEQQASNVKALQALISAQDQRLEQQKYQNKIQQRASDMSGAADSALDNWRKVSTQVYTGEPEKQEKEGQRDQSFIQGVRSRTQQGFFEQAAEAEAAGKRRPKALLKTGDIVFAVLDTAINSDEPGPILATVVSGRLKGAKLIGSFTLPNNGEKMVINFNTLSVPSAERSTSISAYAIDPNTARTALASKVNNHYFMRYAALFASSFLEGFGNAFQSADTTVTIGGSGGGDNITVQNGIGRSALQNAIIGLSTVGKNWGQFAQQAFNKPATVKVYSGTAIGVLFTQDLITL